MSVAKKSSRPPSEANLDTGVDSEDADSVAAFDYELPETFIAQHPIEPRDSARMLVDIAGAVAHKQVSDLAEYIQPGDVIVVNNTRVIRARLALRKPTGGAAEVLLLEPTAVPNQWKALIRPSKKVPPGMLLTVDAQAGTAPTCTPIAAGAVALEAGAVIDDGQRLVTVYPDVIEAIGQVPLPPYIREPLKDPERYQTVFAEIEGSVAAPTAGLHLTERVFDRVKAAGGVVVPVELRVGLATFKPISADRVSDHPMHSESYSVSAQAWETITAASRVIAVGTTVVRTLESVAQSGELSGSTELFIRRGFDWKVVDLLLTNFHVPKSSLLVLVDSLYGPGWRQLYEEAKDRGYRFFSFGDCMLIARNDDSSGASR